MDKINIFEHLKKWGKGYIAYLANVAGREPSTFRTFLSKLKKWGEGTFRTRNQMVQAINKVEQKDYVVNDFDWTWTPGNWNGKK